AKIQSGCSSALRQEFRKLELLDNMTCLRFAGQLPDTVSGYTRGSLLGSYVALKGQRYIPSAVYPLLNWSNLSKDELQPCLDTSESHAILCPSATPLLNVRGVCSTPTVHKRRSIGNH
ncbi:hypothetical protein BC628DRAFT_1334019, partial [Trametes gibbosa]